ncbi:pentatricopeptide repeat-containing protein At1g10910, chloroplastic isoform X1 [Neltuma alba]|uniref:pentatricopeptide repeat-containing protein At1g10910, chloroplastic isoform X1 n=1 Tax=Neltuma alba TaxID=207710 RepID=UPI0010A4A77E|nr:pentatricopeptide repeat-containing protein At1g10910, chloroplastic-like isoform X1 [Prosopis alba]
MEISVLGIGLRHGIAFRNPPVSSSISSASPSATRTVRFQCSSSTALTGEIAGTSNGELPTGRTTIEVQRHPPKPRTARQAAIAEVQQSSDLDSTLARVGKLLKVQDLNAILRNFGQLNRLQDVTQLFVWMQESRKLNASSYISFIKFMGNNLDALKVVEIYNSIQDEAPKTNVYLCNSVLSFLVRKGKFDSSIKLFEKMKEDGLMPDVVTYSTLLAGCIKAKDGYSKALELIQDLQLKRLRMDDVIYGAILAVCASNSKWEEAEFYFNQMKDQGLSPNHYHYSSLLNAYSVCGDYKKAYELVQDMKSAGLVPNKVILTTLLKVYVRGGLFEKSRELLTELESLGYAEDEMPYCLLMDGLAKAGQLQEAKLLFDEMRKKHVRSDGYAHSIMISALCRSKLFDEAKLLANDFEATFNKYDLVMMNTMLCAYCRAGEMESVMQTLRKMDELAISPDYNTFHILIRYFSREKMYLLAYRTMKDMHSKGYQPAEELCSSLMSDLGKVKAYPEAFSVYNILRYGKRTMCRALHEKILHILLAGRLLKDAYVVVKDNAKFISRPAIKRFAAAFMKFGNINMINDVMKTLHGCDHKVDKDLFQTAVSRYIDQPEKKDLLLHLLQWMPSQGYVVDSSTRNLILKNSHLFGRQLVAEVLSKQHIKLKEQNSP